MESSIAIIGIFVEDFGTVDTLNGILHDHRTKIIGRMGLPHHAKTVNIMTIILQASIPDIQELTRQIQSLDGITAKVMLKDT